MEDRKHTSSGVPTFDMIPMLMANLLEDNKILSAKIDALNRKISASVGNSKDEDQRMDVTEAQRKHKRHAYHPSAHPWFSSTPTDDVHQSVSVLLVHLL